MGHKIALVVAVEHYSHTEIPQVVYAEADAVGFSDAIALHGYKVQATLLDSKATKASIESHLRRGLKRLQPDDQFIFYYAGHGFSNSGHNFVTCYDTDPNDLEGTSASLQWVFDLIEKSACKRIAMFLDSCESGITKIAKRRGVYAKMSEAELDEFFGAAEYGVCFSACKTSESSYPSNILKHGIWTYHLIQALRGDAAKALEKGHRLTAVSLQNYLSTEVPLTLRKAYSTPEVQTPWKYGGENRDFQIADLTEILEKRKQVKPGYEQLKRALLREVESVRVSSLSGFVKRHHHVPDYVSDRTKSFVESISKAEIEERVNNVFHAIKEHLNYKHREILSETGRIVTPDFEYLAFCSQDEVDPEIALITEELANIKPSIIENEAFNEVFENRFSQVVFEFPREIDVSKLIDEIEDLDREDVIIKYDHTGSWCELSFKDSEFSLRVEGRERTINSDLCRSPYELLQGFFKIQMRLAGTIALPALKA